MTLMGKCRTFLEGFSGILFPSWWISIPRHLTCFNSSWYSSEFWSHAELPYSAIFFCLACKVSILIHIIVFILFYSMHKRRLWIYHSSAPYISVKFIQTRSISKAIRELFMTSQPYTIQLKKLQVSVWYPLTQVVRPPITTSRILGKEIAVISGAYRSGKEKKPWEKKKKNY